MMRPRPLIDQPTALVTGFPALVLSVLHGKTSVREDLDALLTSSGMAPEDRMALVETLSAINRAAEAHRRISARGSEPAETAEIPVQREHDADLDTEAAAALLDRSPRRVRQLAPELGGRRVGGAWRYSREAVEAYAARRPA